jgi:hypothetical protein
MKTFKKSPKINFNVFTFSRASVIDASTKLSNISTVLNGSTLLTNRDRQRSRNVALTFFPFLFLLLFVSCDDSYYYEVNNRTDRHVLVQVDEIKNSGLHTYTIEPGKTVSVFGDLENSCVVCTPKDLYDSSDAKVPRRCEIFRVYIDEVLMPDSLCRRKNWAFRTSGHNGYYTLRITDELISRMTAE